MSSPDLLGVTVVTGLDLSAFFAKALRFPAGILVSLLYTLIQ